jgi:hypothetical protein
MSFIFNGNNYSIDTTFNNSGYVVQNDLRLWKITGSFPTWSYLYSGSDEVSQAMTIIGRGTPRGDEVIVGSDLKGWKWGIYDGVQSWGRNIVTGTLTDPTDGPLLTFNFDATGPLSIANEGQFSAGDSGGGDFIQIGNVWALAGINFSVTSPYNTTDTGTGFDAAIFDQSGLYTLVNGTWVPAGTGPGTGFSSRISSNLDWLAGWIPSSELRTIPEPMTALLVVGGLAALLNRRRVM